MVNTYKLISKATGCIVYEGTVYDCLRLLKVWFKEVPGITVYELMQYWIIVR